MFFRTIKPILGLKSNGTTTPPGELVELDADDRNTKALLEDRALELVPESEITMMGDFVDDLQREKTAEPAVPDDGGFPTDMTSTESALHMVKPKSKKGKA